MCAAPARPKRRSAPAAGAKREGAAPAAPAQDPRSGAVCRRCGTPAAVGEDGFCEKCEKALEQACL